MPRSRARERRTVENGGGAEDGIAPDKVCGGLRMQDSGNTFEEIDTAARSEDDGRDDHRPEVDFSSVSERVSLIGGPPAEAEASEKKQAGARVDG